MSRNGWRPGDVGPLQIRLMQMDPYSFGSSLHVFRQGRDGKIEVAQPGEVVRIDTNEMLPAEPLLTGLVREDLQMLLDNLYDMGLRPTHEMNTDGRISHIQAHLEDMRTIVFNKKDD